MKNYLKIVCIFSMLIVFLITNVSICVNASGQYNDIPQKGMKVIEFSSISKGGKNELIDGNVNNFWESKIGMPQYVVIDLGKEYEINALRFRTRADGYDLVYSYRIYSSLDGIEFTDIKKGNVVFGDNVIKDIRALFSKTKARYVKFEVTGSQRQVASIAEINIEEYKELEVVKSKEETGIKLPTDIVGTEYEICVGVLQRLGIIKKWDTGNFDINRKITRGEFIESVIKLRIDDVAKLSNIQVFHDVPAQHPQSKYINTAYHLGIINGYSQNPIFSPEKNVAFNEAVKIIVNMAGYGVVAENRGGYPTGYIAMATELGILRNVLRPVDEEVDNAIMSKILYNTLSVKVMQSVGFGQEIKYDISNNKTVISEFLNVEAGVGNITGNYYTFLSGKSDLQRDEVLIDGRKYKTENLKLDHLLGFKVKFYAKYDKIKEEYLLLYVNEDLKNKAIELVGNTIDESSTLTEIKYDIDKNKEDKLKEVKIEANAYYIYNGVADSKPEIKDFLSPCAKVILIDSDNNNVYDIVRIASNDSFIVDSVSKLDEVITGKFSTNNDLVIDMNANNYDKDAILLKDDLSELQIGELSYGKVLSICKSKDNSLVVAKLISNAEVAGVVEEISDDDTMVIGTNEYKINKYAEDSVKNVYIGYRGIFYLDSENQVFAMGNDSTGEDINYGYLLGYSYEDGILGGCLFKILNSNGKIEKFKSSSKFTINKTKIASSDVASYILKTSATLIEPSYKIGTKTYLARQTDYEQVIKYNTNSANEITDIITVNNELDGILNRVDKVNDPLRKYRSGIMQSLNSGISLDAIIFQIPASRTAKDDKYKAGGKSTLVENQIYYCSVPFINKENGLLRIMVYYEDTAAIVMKPDQRAKIVEKISYGVDEDGEMIPIIQAFDTSVNKSIVYNVSNDEILLQMIREQLEPGVAFLSAVDNAGIMITFYKLFSPKDKNKSIMGEYIFGNTSNAIYNVEVISVDTENGYIRFKDVNDSEIQSFFSRSGIVSLFDSSVPNKVRNVTIGDVKAGDRIFVKTINDTPSNIIIYK